MSLRNPLVVILVFVSLSMLAGCGSSGVHVTPPPTGSFSNSNLNGTYVFSVTGTDVGNFFFTAVGSIQANGSGGITGGALDLNDSGNSAVLLLTVQSGVYQVTADGRGIATLVTSQGNLGLAFVLTSTSHGLVTRFDTGGSASGSLDLQSTVTQAQIAGSYAFSFSGINSSGSTLGTVGAFTLDPSGTIATGVQDFNSGSVSVGLTNLTLSGNVLIDTAPGTAQLVTTAGTFTFDVFVIDGTHLKFIETDSLPIVAGDAFTQQTSVPNGPMVFTMAGLDTSNFPFVTGGFMVSDGNGNLTSASMEDINDAGTNSQVASFIGSYTVPSGGRSQLTLTGFDNGAGGLLGDPVFAAYPSSGGLQLLEIDNVGITSGFASAQTSTSLATSQGYGLNLTGSNSGGFEEDDIAEFTNNSGSFSGLVDFNDQGTLAPSRSFSATYAPDSSNSGRAVITSNSFNLVSYVVSGSTVLFIETDQNQVGLGAFQLQSAPATSMAASHLAALRAASHPHATSRHTKAGSSL
jgi:hypothetical protein